MEFILEHQAQFTARMGQLEDLVVRLAKGTLSGLKQPNARVDDVDERISALVDSQIRTEENVEKTQDNVKKTDERLRSLIAVVDRYFSEGRNGNAK